MTIRVLQLRLKIVENCLTYRSAICWTSYLYVLGDGPEPERERDLFRGRGLGQGPEADHPQDAEQPPHAEVAAQRDLLGAEGLVFFWSDTWKSSINVESQTWPATYIIITLVTTARL